MGQTISALAHEFLLGFASLGGAVAGLSWGTVTGLGGLAPARGGAGSSGSQAESPVKYALPAASQAASPVKLASSPAMGVSSPVLHQAGPQLASYRLDTLDSGGSSWSSNHLGSRGEGVTVKEAQHTNSAVSMVNLQVLPGPSRPLDQFISMPNSPQAPSLAPSEAGSYDSEPAADAEGQPRKRRSFRKKLSSGIKRTFVGPFKKSTNASDEAVSSAAASAQAAPSTQ